mmetsp:Transcript_123863/g.396524  ORF Transcript_123863/g.396524 Transcript_123863/m.396524 type:complete len:749 (-) Transcript_123863:3-2249(-)
MLAGHTAGVRDLADLAAGLLGVAGRCRQRLLPRPARPQEAGVARREGRQRAAVREALAPDACGLHQAAVPALPQHGVVVEAQRRLVVVRPQAADVPALPRLERRAQLVELLLEDGDERPPEELPRRPPATGRGRRLSVGGHGLGVGREDLAHEGAAAAAEEPHDVGPARTRVLPNEVCSLVENLPGEVPDAKHPLRVLPRAAEGHVPPASRRDTLHEARAVLGTARALGLEVATGAVVDDSKEPGRPALLALQQRQGRKLASGGQALQLAVAVQTLRQVLLCLAQEDLAVEQLLQTLVAVVDQELLEAVRGEDLEAVEIQQPQEPAASLGRGIGGRRDAAAHEAREPTEESGVQLLGQRCPQRGRLPLAALPVEALLPRGAHGHFRLGQEGLQLSLPDAQQLRRQARRLPGGLGVGDHRHGGDEAATLGDLVGPHTRAEQALDQALEARQCATHVLPSAAQEPRRRGQCWPGDTRELRPLRSLRKLRPEGCLGRCPRRQRRQGGAQEVEHVVRSLACHQVAGDAGRLQHVRRQGRPNHLAVRGEVHLDELPEPRGVRVLPGLGVAEGLQHRRAPQQALPHVVRAGVAHGQELQHSPRGLGFPRPALAGDEQGVAAAGVVRQRRLHRREEVRRRRGRRRSVPRDGLRTEGPDIAVGVDGDEDAADPSVDLPALITPPQRLQHVGLAQVFELEQVIRSLRRALRPRRDRTHLCRSSPDQGPPSRLRARHLCARPAGGPRFPQGDEGGCAS